MIWYWLWSGEHEDRYITKRKNGVVLYSKPRNENKQSFKKQNIKRRLETKRVRTHMRK